MMASKYSTVSCHKHGIFMALPGTDKTEGDSLCETPVKWNMLKIVRR